VCWALSQPALACPPPTCAPPRIAPSQNLPANATAFRYVPTAHPKSAQPDIPTVSLEGQIVAVSYDPTTGTVAFPGPLSPGQRYDVAMFNYCTTPPTPLSAQLTIVDPAPVPPSVGAITVSLDTTTANLSLRDTQCDEYSFEGLSVTTQIALNPDFGPWLETTSLRLLIDGKPGGALPLQGSGFMRSFLSVVVCGGYSVTQGTDRGGPSNAIAEGTHELAVEATVLGKPALRSKPFPVTLDCSALKGCSHVAAGNVSLAPGLLLLVWLVARNRRA
jgi:hypothetical protein